MSLNMLFKTVVLEENTVDCKEIIANGAACISQNLIRGAGV